jgi:hypothetical protein
MTDSAFWRKLAKEFLALPRESVALIYGEKHTTDADKNDWNWRVGGDDTLRVNFEALARRAALSLPEPHHPDLLFAWLEALVRQGHARFHNEIVSSSRIGDVTVKSTMYTLYKLPRHSADYCKILESAALQTEAEEKRRNDPRNWPPLRAEYEVFKTLRDLTSGPHEQIPEALVRDVISQRLKVKPEEVTLKQIQHEVSSLLPYYPAITLIPSAPGPGTTDPPPASSVSQETTIASQIHQLRQECRWTMEKLAEKTGLDVRTVRRHLSGDAEPRLNNLAIYETAFNKELKRKVLIKRNAL